MVGVSVRATCTARVARERAVGAGGRRARVSVGGAVVLWAGGAPGMRRRRAVPVSAASNDRVAPLVALASVHAGPAGIAGQRDGTPSG